jgi:predicted enzyme related to lactoylglutathione lyase
VEPSDGGPRLFFTLVPETKVVKNRMHLDVHTDDMNAEIERLAGLGATVLTKYGDGHVLLADPEGNEFCLMP